MLDIYTVYICTGTILVNRNHLKIFDGREDRGQITTVGLVTFGGDAGEMTGPCCGDIHSST